MLGAAGRQNVEYRGEVLNSAGQRVMYLHAGAKDVSKLSPGVYFVGEAQAQAVRKVVVTQ